MKKRILLFVMAFLLAGYMANIQTVNAYTHATLTVTPGADGSWDTGGYDFNGTGYATKSSFQPLDDVGAFSMIAWIRIDEVEALHIIAGQRVDGAHQARMYTLDDGFYGQCGNGISVVNIATGDIDFNADALQMVAMTWNKNLRGGNVSIYVNTTEYESITGNNLNVDAATDFVVGADHNLENNMEGTLFSLRIFQNKLDAGGIASYYSMGPYYTDPIIYHYWEINEGAGTSFYDYSGHWRFTKEVNFTLDMPNWKVAHNVIVEIMAPIFEGGINALVSLAGLALIPVSTGYLAKGGRSELSLKKLEVCCLLFFIGWAMFLGGILT